MDWLDLSWVGIHTCETWIRVHNRHWKVCATRWRAFTLFRNQISKSICVLTNRWYVNGWCVIRSVWSAFWHWSDGVVKNRVLYLHLHSQSNPTNNLARIILPHIFHESHLLKFKTLFPPTQTQSLTPHKGLPDNLALYTVTSEVQYAQKTHQNYMLTSSNHTHSTTMNTFQKWIR